MLQKSFAFVSRIQSSNKRTRRQWCGVRRHPSHANLATKGLKDPCKAKAEDCKAKPMTCGCDCNSQQSDQLHNIYNPGYQGIQAAGFLWPRLTTTLWCCHVYVFCFFLYIFVRAKTWEQLVVGSFRVPILYTNFLKSIAFCFKLVYCLAAVYLAPQFGYQYYFINQYIMFQSKEQNKWLIT